MGYRVVLLRSAARELTDLPIPIRRRVPRAIDGLTAEPRPLGAKLLVGADGIWRVRVGDYRILYRINDDLVEVLVIRIRHRRDAYRQRHRQYAGERTEVRPQLAAHLLGCLPDVAGEDRITESPGVFADSSFIHQG